WTGTYHDYGEDAAEAVRFLQEVTGLPSRTVGLFGHSEGGWVAPIAASMIDDGPAFIIVSSNTPMTPADQVLFETRASVEEAGFGEDIARALSLQRRVLEYQRSGKSDPDLESDLQVASEQPWFEAAELPRKLYPAEEYAWWRSVMDFDVTPYWRRVKAPVLAISGGLDRNSDVNVSQKTIRQHLAEGGNLGFTGVIYPNMEHGMIEWWLPGGIPPPRFPPGLPDLLIDWVREQIHHDSP
ncbi:MAG: alpha/beta hydrolase, partial [Acidobacteria bacterium]|nr:alpha/beta hydrolase [Acidobacteriota bacterium]